MAKSVLLAEDSFLPALEIRSALVDLGFSVLGPAATSEDALAILAKEPDVAFAVLDVSLRGGTCVPVIHKLKSLKRPFILVTGYSAPDLGEALLGISQPRIITKPFAPRELKEAIRELSLT